ncbi:hypothetical protein Dimus_005763 [Dionaea muscipula]
MLGDGLAARRGGRRRSLPTEAARQRRWPPPVEGVLAKGDRRPPKGTFTARHPHRPRGPSCPPPLTGHEDPAARRLSPAVVVPCRSPRLTAREVPRRSLVAIAREEGGRSPPRLLVASMSLAGHGFRSQPKDSPCMASMLFMHIWDFLLSTPAPPLSVVCGAVFGASEPDGEVSLPQLGDGERGRCGCEVIVTRWAATTFSVSHHRSTRELLPRKNHQRHEAAGLPRRRTTSVDTRRCCCAFVRHPATVSDRALNLILPYP